MNRKSRTASVKDEGFSEKAVHTKTDLAFPSVHPSMPHLQAERRYSLLQTLLRSKSQKSCTSKPIGLLNRTAEKPCKAQIQGAKGCSGRTRGRNPHLVITPCGGKG